MAANPQRSKIRAELDRVGASFRKAGAADYITVTEDSDAVRLVGAAPGASAQVLDGAGVAAARAARRVAGRRWGAGGMAGALGVVRQIETRGGSLVQVMTRGPALA